MVKDVFTLYRPQRKTHIRFLLAAIGFTFIWENIGYFTQVYYKNNSGALLMAYAILLCGFVISLT